MKKKDTAINSAILLFCASAVFMLGVLACRTNQDQAIAATSQSEGGGYIMTAAQVSRTKDIIYVLDNATQRLNAYVVDRSGSDYTIDLIATRNLGRIIQRVEDRRNGD